MRLRKDIHLGTLLALPPASRGWRASLDEQLQLLKAEGYEGAQAWDGWGAIQRAGLDASGIARVTRPEQLDPLARQHRAEGLLYTNLHLGTGFDSDAEMDALAAALLEAQARHGHRLLVETHRATATQDIWRTLRWVERFPDLRFTADLSHWYTGHELTYGGEFAERMARLQPVFERVRAFHGRIGNSGCLQTPLDRPGLYLDHYRAMWTACCAGFLRHAEPGSALSFNAELLPMAVGEGAHAMWLHYQQATQAAPTDPWQGEPCDRFADAEALWAIICACFHQACHDTATETPTP
ncbi:hypothetical protein [Inhella gelatinilytica]|uniref:Sugar phosphate isomerase/epimerase n=1 Tax=Inhella gelatinilytica TaxID=2795030 RepID=A0A931IS73_9BURK|nr:hypothetical protein [Inhella gelatinilytica]MBH9551707.1 hypothetical protein [Inhella gelatinilytica]